MSPEAPLLNSCDFQQRYRSETLRDRRNAREEKKKLLTFRRRRRSRRVFAAEW